MPFSTTQIDKNNDILARIYFFFSRKRPTPNL